MRRTRLIAVAALSASLVLSACGGGDDKEDGPESQEVTKGSTLDSTWPLTGLEVKGDQSSAKNYPVMVVKIDNTAASAPQIGLGQADLVVEELVEGGVTRLATFFYSQLPEKVGPVRSMRASDIGIVAPSDGVMVTSGAAGITIDRINKAGITYYAEGSKGIFRDNSRRAPYNLFSNLKETATLAETDNDVRPDDYLPFGPAEELPAGQPATSLSANFGRHTTSWRYDGKTYVNDNSFAAEGDRFKADNVLVLRVKVGDAGYTDPANNPVPETKFTGKGRAMLFQNGQLIRGTWEKKALDAPLKLSTKAGELTVPPGKTWIELVPANGGDVSFAK